VALAGLPARAAIARHPPQSAGTAGERAKSRSPVIVPALRASMRLIFTRQVAGSKPAAPIPRKALICRLPRWTLLDQSTGWGPGSAARPSSPVCHDRRNGVCDELVEGGGDLAAIAPTQNFARRC
jgi:hypothetical protein